MSLETKQLFDLYTARQEYQPALLDQFGRFPAYLSRSGELFEPHVSNWLFDEGFRPQYPDEKSFAVCLSHDIDDLFMGKAQKLKRVAIDKFSSSADQVTDLFRRRIHPGYALDHLLEAEAEFGAISSFYFMALQEGDEDFNYRLDEIIPELEKVAAAGCEIGLHGGHKAYNNTAQMAREKSRLESVLGHPIIGYRNHYLRFSTPETWKILIENNLKYDTTFGYSDCSGFRNGLCYPFRPFDLNSGQFLNLIEVPLIVMDASLFVNMKLAPKEAMKLSTRLMKTVKACQGVLTILWHNNYMEGEFGQMYRDFLAMANAENAWLTSTGQLINHWQSKGYDASMEQVMKDKGMLDHG